MTTQIDPKTTKIMYIHDRRTGIGIGCIATQKVTTGGIPRLEIGFSACNPKDVFVKIRAKELALRALRLYHGTNVAITVPFTPEDNAFTLRTKTFEAVLAAGCGRRFTARIRELMQADIERAVKAGTATAFQVAADFPVNSDLAKQPE